jgi:hypothetical protein
VDFYSDPNRYMGAADEHTSSPALHKYTGSAAAHEYAPTAGTPYGDAGSAECHSSPADLNHRAGATIADSGTATSDLYALSDADPVPDNPAGATTGTAATGTARTAGSTGTTCADDAAALTNLDSLSHLHAARRHTDAALQPAHRRESQRRNR